MCIGESKAKFFPFTVNRYKYQLTIPVNCSKLLKIKYNILLRLYLFFQLKNLNSLASFIIFVKFLGWIVTIWVRLAGLIGEKETKYKNEIENYY